MEKSVTSNDEPLTNDDDGLSPEEIADIKEYYSNNEKPKRFVTIEELIKELKN
ncbi:MAG: hypothetical protein OEL81_06560 [Nitrosopumilus sp.]|nr:hypothetical protein [Nitrosopumilus sp.]